MYAAYNMCMYLLNEGTELVREQPGTKNGLHAPKQVSELNDSVACLSWHSTLLHRAE